MTTANPTVLFVGESPPPGAAPDVRPFDCASGDRLAKVLGLVSRACLLDHVPRDNIFHEAGVGIGDGPKWNDETATERGHELLTVGSPHCLHAETIVALGRKPGEALGLPPSTTWGTWHRFAGHGVDVLACPHPSGRGSILQVPAARIDARRYLLPEVVAGTTTLRPWHFDLDESDILFDLGAALSPLDVALGVAALRVCQEVHRAQSVPRWEMLKDLSVVQYRGTVDVPLRAIATACPDGFMAVADVLSRVGKDRINVSRIGTELRTRAKAAAADPRCKDYPTAVLRATIGRFVALGVV
jgi:hypothetical protein